MSTATTFAQVLQLELRKQKKTFYSVWLVIVLSVIVVAAFLPLMTEEDSPRILRIMLTMTLTYGVPILAATFAALPASALRRDPEAAIEQALPAPPAIRVLGSLAAAVIFFVVTFLLMVLTSSLFAGTGGFADLLGAMVARSVSCTWLFLMMQILVLGFACSYWLGLSFVGGALALLTAVLELSIPLFWEIHKSMSESGYFVSDFQASWSFDHSMSLIPAACLGCIGAITTLLYLSPRLERGQSAGFPAVIPLIFFLAGGVIFSLCVA